MSARTSFLLIRAKPPNPIPTYPSNFRSAFARQHSKRKQMRRQLTRRNRRLSRASAVQRTAQQQCNPAAPAPADACRRACHPMEPPPTSAAAPGAATTTASKATHELTDTTPGDRPRPDLKAPPPIAAVPCDYSLFGEPLPLFNYLRALEIKRPCTFLQGRTRVNDSGAASPATRCA